MYCFVSSYIFIRCLGSVTYVLLGNIRSRGRDNVLLIDVYVELWENINRNFRCFSEEVLLRAYFSDDEEYG
jgi:hypothetical protein